MRKKLETIEGFASIQDTAKKMKDKNVSSLVVIDTKGKPQGLVTERDLVRKVCINDVLTSALTNKEIMSSIITIGPNSSPSEAADMMLQYNVRHLLVVDNDKGNIDSNEPVGILTPLDFTRYQEFEDDKEKASVEAILEYYI